MPAADDAASERPQFTLTRRVDAPPETVWQLWTDPEELTFWFHPRGASAPRDLISVDLRVGGRYRYTVIDSGNGAATVFGGAYLEIREPERLAFTWGHLADPVEATLVIVTLAAVGERTDMTVLVRGIDGRPGEGRAHDGWDQALDALLDRLASGGPATAPGYAQPFDQRTAAVHRAAMCAGHTGRS